MNSKDYMILRVVELYYKQEIGQQEISQMLGISRPTVSKMIQEAKKRNIITFNINTPIELNYELSNILKKKFKLKDVLVVKGNEENSNEVMKKVSHVAARFLISLINSEDRVGISWGKSIKQVVDSIPDTDLTDIRVIQIVGSLGSGDPAVDGPELVYKLARKLNGEYKYINSPAIVSDEQVKNFLLNQNQIQKTLSEANECQTVLMGFGSLSEEFSSMQRSGYLDTETKNKYIEKGAVGHILAQMIDNKGNPVSLQNNHVIGVNLDSLRRKKWSIGIVSQSFKYDITLAAIQGGYVNSLVIDEYTAINVLSSYKNNNYLEVT